MATTVRYVGNGATTAFSIPFSYVLPAHVKVYLNGVLQNSGYTVNPGTVTFSVAPATGDHIKILRDTSQSARLTDYVSAGMLGEATLDADSIQAFNMAQEALDWKDEALVRGTDSAYDAASRRITNVDTPIDNGDAVPKGYADANVALAQNAAMQAQIYAGIAQSTVVGTAGFGIANKIINPDFRINQRNANTAVACASTNAWVCDRWGFRGAASTAGRVTGQMQTSGGLRSNGWVRLVSTGANPPSVSARLQFGQPIEGRNVADLRWGTADARSAVLTFDFRASVVGTYSASLQNSAGDRSFVFSFSVTASDTFQTYQVDVPGPTSGTWLVNNGIGALLLFDVGSGTDLATGSTGVWVNQNVTRGVVHTPLSSTSGATVGIGAVQLEVANFGSKFEVRPDALEFALCQRYREKSYDVGTDAGAVTMIGREVAYAPGSAAPWICSVDFKVPKRAAPVITLYSPGTGASGQIRNVTGGADVTAAVAQNVGENGFDAQTSANATANNLYAVQWVAEAEL